jgi:putative membrane protein
MAQPHRIMTISRRVATMAAVTAVTLLSSTVATSAPAPGVPESIVDNETVYVVASADGTPRTTVVVDWLQIEGTGSFAIADPVPGVDAIESLTDGFAPVKVGDELHATVNANGAESLFYRANTTAELPLEIGVEYFLDGVRTEPDELAGKDGRLRIEITLTNRLEQTETITYVGADGVKRSSEVTYSVPLLCVPQFELDGARMTGIEAPESAQIAITGSTLTYAIPIVPLPEGTAIIEMDARDIELAPLMVTVFPKLPGSADFSVAEDLLALRDGLSGLEELSAAHMAIIEGVVDGLSGYDLSAAEGAAEGLAALQTGLGQLGSGAEDLAALSGGQYAYLDGIITAIDASQFASLSEITAAVGQMRQAAAGLHAGAAGLVALLDGQIALTEAVQASNAGLIAAASALPASVPATYAADPAMGDLFTGIGGITSELYAQQAMIAALLDGGDLGAGYMPGLRYTRAQLAEVADGLAQLAGGLEALEDSLKTQLPAIPAAFTSIRDALLVLRDGGTLGERPFPGLGTVADGLTGLADGLAAAEDGLAGSAGDLEALAQMPAGIAQLTGTLRALAGGGSIGGRHVPGLSTTVDSLGQMSGGLGEGVEEIRKGEALQEAMSAAADAYTSFLGLPEGATGRLTFLFKLDGVKK